MQLLFKFCCTNRKVKDAFSLLQENIDILLECFSMEKRKPCCRDFRMKWQRRRNSSSTPLEILDTFFNIYNLGLLLCHQHHYRLSTDLAETITNPFVRPSTRCYLITNQHLQTFSNFTGGKFFGDLN